ncbi:hypothetical protein ON010_g14497 [Phytophthora cinnamomi]|nr:hypothetical protein ON010_g14497 [Phytophthora cinnamomi]
MLAQSVPGQIHVREGRVGLQKVRELHCQTGGHSRAMQTQLGDARVLVHALQELSQRRRVQLGIVLHLHCATHIHTYSRTQKIPCQKLKRYPTMAESSRRWVTALLLLMTWSFFGNANPSTIDELWQTADKLWRSDDLDSTMDVLRHIETLQPGDRFVLVGMASILQRQRQFDRALEMLDAVLAQTPDDYKVLQRIGEVYTDMREIPKALEFLHAAERQMHTKDKSEVDALTHRLALAYHHGGDFTTAEKLFDRVGASGRSAAFYFDFGVTLENLGKAHVKILAAGDAYNQALALEPTQAEARINIAALHHQHGDVNESIPQYLLVINSPSAPAKLRIMAMGNVGVAYEVSRDIVNALSWYERALEEISTSPNLYFADRFSAETSRMHLMVHTVRAKLSACVWENAENEFDSLWAMVTNLQIAVGNLKESAGHSILEEI